MRNFYLRNMVFMKHWVHCKSVQRPPSNSPVSTTGKTLSLIGSSFCLVVRHQKSFLVVSTTSWHIMVQTLEIVSGSSTTSEQLHMYH